MVFPSEAMECTALFLEERRHVMKVVERFYSSSGIKSPPGVCPSCVAFLIAGAEDDNVRAPFRPPHGAERDPRWESNFVK